MAGNGSDPGVVSWMAATPGSPGRCRSTFTSELSSQPVPHIFLGPAWTARARSWSAQRVVPRPGSFLGSRKPTFTAGGWWQHGL